MAHLNGASNELDEVKHEKVELTSIEDGNKETSEDEKEEIESKKLLYGIEDNPPWHMSLILGFQQFLTMFGGNLATAVILANALCIPGDDPGRAFLISTFFFMSGIITLLQTTFGIRLPMIQGASFSFLMPSIAILNLDKWKCPTQDYINEFNLTSEDVWYPRMREIQGAVLVSSLFEVGMGAFGVTGFIIRYVTPLTIAPTITLLGLTLFPAAATESGKSWGISMLTFVLIALFSEYMRNIKLPFPAYSKERKCHVKWVPAFQLFPVLLSILITWCLCYILTFSNAVDEESAIWIGKSPIIEKSPWFRVPYPGQWGMPTVSVAAVFGMLAGVIASMVESIGDYYACANISSAPRPPVHAINRGLMIEGIGGVLAGLFGTGNGTTTLSQNIAAIGITKVASRRVIQFAALCMIVFGVLGKFGALFVSIPNPIMGGLFFAMFGMIAAVGLSTLQYVNMNSSRNLFILGSALMLGFSIPYWFKQHTDVVIVPGSIVLDQLLRVLLSTDMLLGGLIGFVMDNTIPGTVKERGVDKWRKNLDVSRQSETSEANLYDIPIGMSIIRRYKIFKYIPFCPTFSGFNFRFCKKKKSFHV